MNRAVEPSATAVLDAPIRPMVRMTGITVSFESGTVLHDVDLELLPGEIHALMGENGAGKSTLIKALTAVYRLDAGEIELDGELQRFANAVEAKNAGIAAVFQEVQLCDNLSIGENVMLGHEVRNRWGISWKPTHERAEEMLAELGLEDLDTHRPLRSLSPAIQQLVSIARAMVDRPKVLVLDEPTSSLDSAEVARLFAVLRRLRDQGVAILFVSHFLEQVFSISDRMTVLRGGRVEGVYETQDIDRADLIAHMMGKDLASLKLIGSERRAHRVDPTGPALYRASALGRRGQLEPTDLELYRGEVVGIAGLRGSGRTELAQLLSGADRHDSGTVWLGGKEVGIASPSAGLRNKIALSSEKRTDEGVVLELSIRDNLVLAIQALRGWARPLSHSERDEMVASYIEAFDITPSDPSTPVKYLSGGNQQKVLLARWLATRPRVLILDEPTRGVDIATKVQIQAQIAQLARDGVCVVFISSELEEVVRVSDRIVVLKDREKIGEVSNGPRINVDTIVEMIASDFGDDDEDDD